VYYNLVIIVASKIISLVSPGDVRKLRSKTCLKFHYSWYTRFPHFC